MDHPEGTHSANVEHGSSGSYKLSVPLPVIKSEPEETESNHNEFGFGMMIDSESDVPSSSFSPTTSTSCSGATKPGKDTSLYSTGLAQSQSACITNSDHSGLLLSNVKSEPIDAENLELTTVQSLTTTSGAGPEETSAAEMECEAGSFTADAHHVFDSMLQDIALSSRQTCSVPDTFRTGGSTSKNFHIFS